MKYLKHLPLLILAIFIVVAIGYEVLNWHQRTIMEIETVPYDSLVLGKDKSLLVGDSIEIVGRVVAPAQVNTPWGLRTLLRGTNSWTVYLQDTTNALWGGIVVRQASRYTNTFLQNVDTGNIIKVRGKVQEFWSTTINGTSGFLTQIEIDTNSGPISILSLQGSRPQPKAVHISDFVTGDYPNGGTINYVDGEKYEGMYVEFKNVTTAAGLANRQIFSIIDSVGNRIYVRDYSNFYGTSPSPTQDTLYKLWNWAIPTAGTQVNYIRGVIINANNEGIFGNLLPYVLIPIYPNDISLGQVAPTLSNPTRTPGVPTPSDSATINVTITSPTTISNASLYYRVNGGAFLSKTMTNVAGNIYKAVIPQNALNSLVEYFIKATNQANLTTFLPSDTSRSKLFYIVHASDSLSIQDVQYCPNNGGHSGYEGATVRGIEGIVTSDTTDIHYFSCTSNTGCLGGDQTAPERVIIQNGQGPFSGIWIYGTAVNNLQRGQRVRVKGVVENNYGVIRIDVASTSDVTIISGGNPLPTPQILTTAQLANAKTLGDTTIKKWESVLVRINTPVVVTCANANKGISCTSHQTTQDTSFRRNFGEIWVTDNSNVDARITLQGGGHNYTNNWDGNTVGKTLITQNDSISFIQGILYYSYSNYKITPRKNSDFGTLVPIGIHNISELVGSYQLQQNFPNPFNPTTKIKYSIPISGFVSLKVYDMLGREVRTLVNQSSAPGSFIVDFNASELSSGIYFYRMSVTGVDGSTFTDVRKMVLVK